MTFPHNDWHAVDDMLIEVRSNYERVVIILEGLYSMEGDIPDLKHFIELRNRHKVFLMIDEAHSIGVLGERGYGIGEHFTIHGSDVDIWMGTLSKTLASSGGYIAGSHALIENLKFSAPGFLYSVGIAPPVAAASKAAIEVMNAEPDRIVTLRNRSSLFHTLAGEQGLNTGTSDGYAIIPIILGSSLATARLSQALFKHGINVLPIIYPAVEERAARLRFFLNTSHTEEQIHNTVDILAVEMKKLGKRSISTLFR